MRAWRRIAVLSEGPGRNGSEIDRGAQLRPNRAAAGPGRPRSAKGSVAAEAQLEGAPLGPASPTERPAPLRFRAPRSPTCHGSNKQLAARPLDHVRQRINVTFLRNETRMPRERFRSAYRALEPGEPTTRTAGERGIVSAHCFARQSSTITPRRLLSSSGENSALR